MAKTKKQEIRRKFRDDVFKRDGYRCVVCGFQSSPEKAELELDAHHIWPREYLPNGGYVKENGVSLCDPDKSGASSWQGCHWKAEEVLLRYLQDGVRLPQNEQDFGYPYSPKALYEKIGSSPEKAQAESLRLT
jgi:hypothetical protein